MQTIKDLAERAGVSKSTASKALSGRADVGAATRERVLAVAREMGYQPDPGMRRLSEQRWRGRRKASSVVLGYFLDQHHTSNRSLRLEGARRRAAALGFTLEVVEMGTGLENERTLRRLAYRGVQGLVIDMVFAAETLRGLNFDRFALAGCGIAFERPPIHIVVPNFLEGADVMVERLRGAGARRIGCVQPIKDLLPSLNDRHRLAAFSLIRESLPEACGEIPLLVCDTGQRGPVEAWFERYRPEVVVGGFDFVYDWIPAAARGRTGFCSLMSMGKTITGTDLRWEEIGVAAIDLVESRLRRNEFGYAAVPVTHSIVPIWRTGETWAG